MTACYDCSRSTAGMCWRHPNLIVSASNSTADSRPWPVVEPDVLDWYAENVDSLTDAVVRLENTRWRIFRRRLADWGAP